MRVMTWGGAAVLVGAALAGVPAEAEAQTKGRTARAQATFAKDVAPIFQKACQNCHRPNNIAPMSLLTYEDARPWARSIRTKVAEREMPPWYIDRNVGIQTFDPDPSLTDEEIATIVRWVDGGAPLGNLSDMPPPRTFDDSDRWHIGTPDIIATLPKDVIVKAAAPDQWIDVEMTHVDIPEDRYIKAVEVKPSKGTPVVHHAVASTFLEEDPELSRTLLVEYAVGKFGDIFPDGAGRLLKAGSKLVMNLHLHSLGEETPANVVVGIKLYPKDRKPTFVETVTHVGDNEDLDIPAGEPNARSEGYTVLSKPVRLTSFQPHLHNRGKAQCVEAIIPNAGPRPGLAKTETLSCVNRYRFNWHIVYHYAEDVQPLLPAGTMLHVISWHDNTAGNKFNPDPTNWAGFGQRSIDDMAFAWMTWYELTDEQYKEMVAERARQSKAKASTQQQQQQQQQ
jgi:mono/diheme cytochrome c family protein